MPDNIPREKSVIDTDTHELHKMGYTQELARRMHGFSNFAISFSTICILAGGITSFQAAYSSVGGFGIGVGWLIGGLFAMAAALGLKMHNEKFQLAVMNDTEPSASDIVTFENDLKQHRVNVLFYNSQASNQSAKRVQKLAHQAKVPIVGVTETEPAGQPYQGWMLSELDSLEHALSHK